MRAANLYGQGHLHPILGPGKGGQASLAQAVAHRGLEEVAALA